ncbi:hypothetical protein TraAM80_07463 [Trypanosoma rangeli]|uniref:RRM domain-containing protein n=1 Tax=Trypanosoma rangeli TaxID=5698 RepID=A0A3R7K2L8_TRYRA|nr:uncharacterized protein TraAM80_07463 [Trypanosoma rangeli]RNF00689.1 hypothetical protein TraAM80_07463 [Trypanosoma rangeli]|eukprot:RNF00689.1 hypothetical protein TraAM80_07463 [Trypanosoma rangeli]
MAVDVVARLSNLPTSVTEAHIRELIEPFAKVRRVTMPSPVLWLSCPTGRAEVAGDTLEDTKLVYVHLHGTVMDGNRINVSFAKLGDGAGHDSSGYNRGAVDRAPRPLERRDSRVRRPRGESGDGWRQRESALPDHRRHHPEDERQTGRQDRRRSPRRSPSSSPSRLSSPSRRRRRHSRSSSSSSSSSSAPRRRRLSTTSQRRRWRKRRRTSSRPRRHSRSRSPSWGN